MKGYKNVGLPKQKSFYINKDYKRSNRFWEKKQALNTDKGKTAVCFSAAAETKQPVIQEKRGNSI